MQAIKMRKLSVIYVPFPSALKDVPLLWRNVEGTGLVLLGEEKASGRPHCGLPIFEGRV